MVDVSVIGARGYLGRELVRILLQHPEVDAVVPVSSSAAGQPLGDHVRSLRRSGLTFTTADDSKALDADVAMLATPGGVAAKAAAAHLEHGAKAVIDLSRDHRAEALTGGEWTYGLADVWPVEQGTSKIANPGCYPTASLLAIGPALQAGLVAPGPIIVDGKSGVSGAGVSPQPHLHYPEMNESVSAYKVLGHDHTAEIAGACDRMDGSKHAVRFTPHLVPQTRGLLATVYAPATDVDPDGLKAAYEKAYADSRFVSFVDEASTGHVRGGNTAEVAVDVDPDTGLIVARGAIDNLLKGGSGTAVQNMNDTLGLPTAMGLPLYGGSL